MTSEPASRPPDATRVRRTTRVGRPPVVDREAIVRAAVEVGFGRIAMTTVGERLGVRHSTLYRCFDTRDALVAAAVDHVVDAAEWPEAGRDWQRYLREFAWAGFTLMNRHPGLAQQIVSLRVDSPAYSRQMHRATVALTGGGFSATDAILAQDLVAEQVLFFFLVGQRDGEPPAGADLVARRRRELLVGAWPDEDPLLREAMAQIVTGPAEQWFARKLEVLLDGLARLARLPRPDGPSNGEMP